MSHKAHTQKSKIISLTIKDKYCGMVMQKNKGLTKSDVSKFTQCTHCQLKNYTKCCNAYIKDLKIYKNVKNLKLLSYMC